MDSGCTEYTPVFLHILACDSLKQTLWPFGWPGTGFVFVGDKWAQSARPDNETCLGWYANSGSVILQSWRSVCTEGALTAKSPTATLVSALGLPNFSIFNRTASAFLLIAGVSNLAAKFCCRQTRQFSF